MPFTKPLHPAASAHPAPRAVQQIKPVRGSPLLVGHMPHMLAAASLLAAVGCGAYFAAPTANPANEFAAQLLTNLPVGYLQNAESSLSSASAAVFALRERIAEFLLSPDSDRLIAARQAWRVARHAWQRSEVYNLVAATDRPLAGDPLRSWATNRIDPWPVDVDFIQRIIGNTAGEDSSLYALTQSNLVALSDDENAASSVIGFHAIEWLLWSGRSDIESGESAPFEQGSALLVASLLTAFDPDTPATYRRRRYLSLIADQLAGDVSHLNVAWNDSADGYAAQLKSTPPLKALSTVLEGLIALLEREMLHRSLAVPLGTANPALTQSPYSRNSLNDIAANLSGIEDVMFGLDGKDGVIVWLHAHDPAAADRVKRELKFAASALRRITGSLHATITTGSAQTDRLIANSLIKALESAAQTLRQVSLSMKLELPGRNSWEASG